MKTLEDYKKEFNYFSPNIIGYDIRDYIITFHTLRYIGGDSICSVTRFFVDTKKIKQISNYEKQYIEG